MPPPTTDRKPNGQRTPQRSGVDLAVEGSFSIAASEVKARHDLCRGVPEDRAQSIDGDRADLLGLGLGVLRQPGRAGGP